MIDQDQVCSFLDKIMQDIQGNRIEITLFSVQLHDGKYSMMIESKKKEMTRRK